VSWQSTRVTTCS